MWLNEVEEVLQGAEGGGGSGEAVGPGVVRGDEELVLIAGIDDERCFAIYEVSRLQFLPGEGNGFGDMTLNAGS